MCLCVHRAAAIHHGNDNAELVVVSEPGDHVLYLGRINNDEGTVTPSGWPGAPDAHATSPEIATLYEPARMLAEKGMMQATAMGQLGEPELRSLARPFAMAKNVGAHNPTKMPNRSA